MNTAQYNHLFSFIWNIANDVFVNAVHNSDSDTAQIQCNEDLFKIVINMMAEHTEFARNYLDNENFRNFVNSRVFQQARVMV